MRFSPKRVPSLLAAVVLGGAVLTARSAWADSILINDLADSAVMSWSSTGRIVQNGLNPFCFGETCEAIVLAPSLDATIVASDIFRNLTTGLISLSEPGGVAVSDYFTSDVEPGGASFKFGFGSDSENGGLALCAGYGGCALTENGMPQLVGTVTWSDGTVDTVYVQSDVEASTAVPEPSSLLLSGIGIGLFICFGRRTRARARALTT